MTQFFFEVETYLRFVDRAQGPGHHADHPRDHAGDQRGATAALRAVVRTPLPGPMIEQFDRVADDPQAVVEHGVEIASTMSAALLEAGRPGLHFYTLNRSFSTLRVYRDLGLTV